VVLDVQEDPILPTDVFIRQLANVRFLVAVPMIAEGSSRSGLLVLADSRPRSRWPAHHRRATGVVAHQLARDLSNQNRLERQQLGFDEGIRFIADEVDELVALLDPSGKHLYNNPPYRELFGDPDKLRGTDSFEQIHPSDRERARQLFLQAVESKSPQQVVYRAVLPGGATREIDSRGTPILDGARNVSRVLVVSRDKTKREAFEREETRKNRELQRRHSEMSSLNQMANLLHRCEALEEMKIGFRQYEEGLFPDSAGAIYVFNPGLGQFEEFVVWGEVGFSKPYFSKHECWAVRSGSTHVVADVDPTNTLLCKHVCQPAPSYLCVNVTGQGDTNVVLHLQLPFKQSEFTTPSERARWISAEQEVALAVARHVALAIDKLQQKDSLQRRAELDGLTGLFNRGFMDEILRREVLRYARNHSENRRLGVIMIDIDHFKQINTEYTHVAGDYVLSRVGEFLRDSIRDTDFACRYGGEEFLLIMPDASDAGLRDRAETLLQGARALKLQWGDHPIQVTLSAGAACLSDDAVDVKRAAEATAELATRKVDELKGAAGEALRRAKHHGRDRVVLWQQSSADDSNSTPRN
jgi:diguanylate cyclase (GGDEF)-like protein/PAS domain S-box-containing protein